MKKYLFVFLGLLAIGCHKKEHQSPIAALSPTVSTTQHSFSGIVASSSTVTVDISPFNDETDTFSVTRAVGWSWSSVNVCPANFCYTINGKAITVDNRESYNQTYVITTITKN